MAFSDPQTVTVNAVAQVLPRTGSGEGVGTFTKDDGNVSLRIRHTYGRRNRRNVQFTLTKVAPDPFLANVNLTYSYSINVTVDAPPVGFTNTELKQGVDGVLAYLSASSGAKITQLLGGES